MPDQLDLFGKPPAVARVNLREEELFGQRDARTGLGIRNYYSERISGDRLAAYEKAFRQERAKQAGENQ